MEHWGLLGPSSPPNRFNHSTNPCSRSAVPALSGCESAPRPPTLVGFVWASRAANRRDEFAEKTRIPGLVNVYITENHHFLLENHHFSWENQRFPLGHFGKGMPWDAKGQRCHGDAHLLSDRDIPMDQYLWKYHIFSGLWTHPFTIPAKFWCEPKRGTIGFDTLPYILYIPIIWIKYELYVHLRRTMGSLHPGCTDPGPEKTSELPPLGEINDIMKFKISLFNLPSGYLT